MPGRREHRTEPNRRIERTEKHAPSSNRARPRDRRLVPAVVLLVVAVAIVYAGSLDGPFIFDDIQNIVENPSIRSLWSPAPGASPADESGIASRPVIRWTLALNHALGGLDPLGYHLLNVLIHILATLTLFGVVRRTLLFARAPGCPRGAPTPIDAAARRDTEALPVAVATPLADAATPLAAGAALLWGVHPLQTQAVTYTIQRCESLMGLFFLLVFYCAIRGWQAGTSGPETEPIAPRGRPWAASRARWQAAAVAALLLGIGSKEVVLVAPALLLLYDLLFVHHGARAAWRASRGLYLGLGLGLLLGAALIASVSAGMLQQERSEVSLAGYALTQPAVILHYLRLALWPDALSLDYTWPVMPLARTWPALLALLALLALTVRALASRRAAGFLGAWFFLTLAPSSSIVPLPDLAFEHRMYLPLAALTATVVVGGFALQRRFAPRRTLLFGLILALLALALGARTVARNRDYRSTISIWSDTVRKQPLNARARLSLGVALAGENRRAEALEQVSEAVRLNPRLVRARVNLGILLLEMGQGERALPHLREAAALDPGEVQARSNLGIALCQIGRLEEGIAELRAALELDPACVEAHFNLSIALREQGRDEESRRHFEEAYRLDPGYVLPGARP